MDKEYNKINSKEVNIENIDSFYQKAITNILISEIKEKFTGVLLDVGCGVMPYKESIMQNEKIEKYIGIDIYNPSYQKGFLPDIIWDGKTLPVENNFADNIIMTDVIEHLPNPKIVIEEISRVLKEEGFLFATIPFLWPLHDVPNDECRYTPFSLNKILSENGFSKIVIKSLGGWNASLATMLGLWLKRSKGNAELKKELTNIFIEMYKMLIDTDETDNVFSESSMHTGFYLLAYK